MSKSEGSMLVADAMKKCFVVSDGSNRNVADALFELSYQLSLLGNAGASLDGTQFGAIEGHAMMIKESAELVAAAIGTLSDYLADT